LGFKASTLEIASAIVIEFTPFGKREASG